jgi:hypothetical protein
MTVLYKYAGGRHDVMSSSRKNQDSSANSQLSHRNITMPGRKKTMYWTISSQS